MSMYSTALDAMAHKMIAAPRSSSKAEEQGVAAAAGPEALAAVSAAKMRCGGCGGKVSFFSYPVCCVGAPTLLCLVSGLMLMPL